MRRWLSILLLVLLPFQFSWAAAASYCQHETGRLAAHFGHHEHQHEHQHEPQHERAKLKTSSTDQGDANSKLGALDNDCAVCHLGCVSPVANPQVVHFVRGIQVHELNPIFGFESHISGVPQRPDCSLAA